MLGQPKEESKRPEPDECRQRSRNAGLWQRAIPPLRKMTERGAMGLLWPSVLSESICRFATGGCLADEPDQSSLVGHKVTLKDGHVAFAQPVHGHAFEP